METAGPGAVSGGTATTPLVEELRDETLVAIECERLVRAVTAMHSVLAAS
jgi:hypothetical protein